MKKIKVFKNEDARQRGLKLYEQKRNALSVPTESKFVGTSFGRTHLLCLGHPGNPPVLVFHGINAGSPMALEALTALSDRYYLIGVDTIGQATLSDPVRVSLEDDSYGKWVSEIIDESGLSGVQAIGVSYGGFILRKYLELEDNLLKSAVFVVPGGFANGDKLPTFKRITLPLIKFFFTKKDKALSDFLDSFNSEVSDFEMDFHRNTLLGVNVDFRRPPLFKCEDAAHFTKPVYLMTAEEDVFFPGDKVRSIFTECFKNFKDSYMLPGSKHVPARHHYHTICSKIGEWLDESA